MKKLLTLLAFFVASCSPLPAQNTLAGNLTVQQSVKFTGDITPPQLTADVDDYAPASFSAATFLRVAADAPRVITGLAGGADGRIVWLSNIGGYPISLAHAFTGSAAANRFDLGGANYELAAGNGLGLWYDATAARWRPLSGLAAGGGGGGTGTVSSVAVTTANGVSAAVANPTTTPTLTFSLGAITPSSVAATGNVTGANLTGTNTGDQSDATLTFSDVTTNNVSTMRHGFAPKLPNDAAKYLDGTGAWSTPAGGGGSGTVTSVSVVSANGVSGSVANASTTPAITLSIGAIAPTSVAASGTVTGSNLSGTNTGDQASVTGNAGTATKLQTARTINGVSFDGTANITVPAAAGTLTGSTLASGVTASSLTSAAGGTFGTAAFTAASAYDPAGAAAAITLSGLGGVPTSRTVNGHALTGNVTVTAADTGAEPGLGSPASSGQVLASTAAGVRSWVTLPTSSVNSVFGRTGAVTAQAGDYTKADVGLGSVENTALSTWAGSGNIATVGTISAGTWHGTAIADAYVAGASGWNAKVSFPGFGATAGTAAEGNDSRLSDARTPLAHNQAWSTIATTPTTLSGYGISDAQPLDSDLTAIAALTTTTYGRSLLTPADAVAARTLLGISAGSGDVSGPSSSVDNAIARFDGTGGKTIQSSSASIDDSGNLVVNGNIQISGDGRRILADFSNATPANRTLFQSSVTNGATAMWLIPNGTSVNTSLRMSNGSDPANSGNIDMYITTGSSGFRSAIAGTGSYQPMVFQTGGSTALTISTSRTVSFNAYGAGTLVTDSSGTITASSDARLKNVLGKFTRGLDSILQLQPKEFTWRPGSGMNPDDVNVGFIAQDVQAVIPEAVGSTKTSEVEEDDGKGGKIKKTKREDAEFLSLSDRPILAALVNAVKELKAENDALLARVAALEKGKATK